MGLPDVRKRKNITYAHASAIVCARQDMHVRIPRIHPQSKLFLLCAGHLVSYGSQAVRDIMARGAGSR